MTEALTEALIVVDMQTAFVAPDGASAVDGADAVLTAVNAEVTAAVAHGRPVFYTRDVAPSELPPGDPDGQTELADGLVVEGTVVAKGPGKDGNMSGFLRTGDGIGAGGIGELAAGLKAAGPTRLRVVGLATDVCVAATCRDARRLGYEVTLVLAATAFVHAHPDGDAAALADLRAAGVDIEGAPG